MKTVDRITIEEALGNTEFGYLIPKFKSAGEDNLQSMALLHSKGKLLDYLKEFEDDSDKRLRLYKRIKEQIEIGNKPIQRAIALWAIIGLVAFLLIVILIVSVA